MNYVSTTFVNTVVIPWLTAVVLLCIPTFAAAGFWWGRKWLIKRGYRTDVYDALGRAAAAGYKAVSDAGMKITDKGASEVALNAGKKYILGGLTEQKMSVIDMSPESAAKVIDAEIGKLMVVDPTVQMGDAVPAITNVTVAIPETPKAA